MGYISAVYFSSWSVYESKHFALELPVERLSHVFYAFMKINPSTGTVSLSDPWADVEMPMKGGFKGSLSVLADLKRRNRHLKVIMSIGGWGTNGAFEHVMKDERRMKTFVVTAIDLLIKHKFDGIDVDWEYPQNAAHATQLVHLLAMFRNKLNGLGGNLALTVAAPSGQNNISNLHVVHMNRYLSFWNIMCYDFAGEGWSTRTGYHSNLYGVNGDNALSGELVINTYISLGVPPHKLVLGMPMYGRSFKRPSAPYAGSRFTKRAASSDDIIEYRAIDRSEEVYDEIRVATCLYDMDNRLLIMYDNPRCAAEKAKFVVKRGLGGGFWWDSKGDTPDGELFSAFFGGLDGSIENSPNWV